MCASVHKMCSVVSNPFIIILTFFLVHGSYRYISSTLLIYMIISAEYSQRLLLATKKSDQFLRIWDLHINLQMGSTFRRIKNPPRNYILWWNPFKSVGLYALFVVINKQKATIQIYKFSIEINCFPALKVRDCHMKNRNIFWNFARHIE